MMGLSDPIHAATGGFGFTLCRVADHARSATKTIMRAPDGKLSKSDYDFVREWRFTPEIQPTLEAMADRMRLLAGEPQAMLIMGHPVSGLDLAKPQRRLWASSSDPNTLAAVARSWLPIDCDDVVLPAPLGRSERLAEAGAHVRDHLLPVEFRGVSCIVGPSTMTGMKGETLGRLRLFFLLDKALPLEDLRRWGKGAAAADLPVDPMVIQPGQPIYTARPIFVGIDDPVPERLRATVLDGVIADRVSLVLDRFDPTLARVEARVSAATAAAGPDWRKLLDETLGAEAGFFEPLSAGLGLAVAVGATEAEVLDFTTALLRERADPGRVAQYGGSWLSRNFRSFRSRDAAARGRLAAAQDAFRLFPLGALEHE